MLPSLRRGTGRLHSIAASGIEFTLSPIPYLENLSLQSLNPSPLLIVGSVGIDDVKTPLGEVRGVLGGAASYAATAASFFAPAEVVAVVGDDFPQEHIDFLAS